VDKINGRNVRDRVLIYNFIIFLENYLSFFLKLWYATLFSISFVKRVKENSKKKNSG
jgi:hypothetical protein